MAKLKEKRCVDIILQKLRRLGKSTEKRICQGDINYDKTENKRNLV